MKKHLRTSSFTKVPFSREVRLKLGVLPNEQKTRATKASHVFFSWGNIQKALNDIEKSIDKQL